MRSVMTILVCAGTHELAYILEGRLPIKLTDLHLLKNMICNNLYRQLNCRETARMVTRNTLRDLFSVRVNSNNTADITELQGFITKKDSL